MIYQAFAAKAAVITAVFAIASSATAATVDSLDKPPFFPASTQSEDVTGNISGDIAAIDVTEPAPFQITVNAVQGDEPDEVISAVMDSPTDFFEGTDPHKDGIADERAYGNDMFLAKAAASPMGLLSHAVERSYMSAAAANAIANPATGIAVPLPASGILLICGLFGLSRMARRKA